MYAIFEGIRLFNTGRFRFLRSKMLGFKKCVNYKMRLQTISRKKVAALSRNQTFFYNNYEAYGSQN